MCEIVNKTELTIWTTSKVPKHGTFGGQKWSITPNILQYGRESQGTRTQERLRWQEPAAYRKDRPVLSSERAPQTVTLKQ
jgi:hypothetical protein